MDHGIYIMARGQKAYVFGEAKCSEAVERVILKPILDLETSLRGSRVSQLCEELFDTAIHQVLQLRYRCHRIDLSRASSHASVKITPGCREHV